MDEQLYAKWDTVDLFNFDHHHAKLPHTVSFHSCTHTQKLQNPSNQIQNTYHIIQSFISPLLLFVTTLYSNSNTNRIHIQTDNTRQFVSYVFKQKFPSTNDREREKRINNGQKKLTKKKNVHARKHTYTNTQCVNVKR